MTDQGEGQNFGRKAQIIQETLDLVGYGFEESMTDEERDRLDVERQSFVLRAGWNNMSIEELEEMLTQNKAGEKVGDP